MWLLNTTNRFEFLLNFSFHIIQEYKQKKYQKEYKEKRKEKKKDNINMGIRRSYFLHQT